MSDLPTEACVLHKGIFIALDHEIAKGTSEYSRFECIAGSYLGEGDTAKCSSMIDLLKKMQSRGLLKVGSYKDLKDMLFQADLVALREMVEKREVEIVKILGKRGDEKERMSNRSPIMTRPVKRLLADEPPEPPTPTKVLKTNMTKGKQLKTSRRRTVKSTAVFGNGRISAPPSPREKPVATLQGTGNIVSSPAVDSGSPPSVTTGPINNNSGQICFGNATFIQHNNSPKPDVKAKSEAFQAHCKSKINDLHVETQPCKEARSQLNNKQAILLVGNSGDGKSSALDYLAANPLEGYHPVPCNSPEDIDKYIDRVTTIQLLFICDEPFGSSYRQKELVENWINKGKNLEMHLKNHKFVFATRKSVWNECKTHLDESPFFRNILDVSSEKLTKGDKQNMLKKYLGESEHLTEREKNEIVDNDKPIAYAQCCKLMSDAIKRCHTGKKLVEIFKRPFTFLSKEIEKIAKGNKAQYATLCLIMLCGGEIECEELSDVTDNEVKVRMNVVVGVFGCKQLELQECAKSLSGAYLVKTEKGNDFDSSTIYKFSHDSIAEAVTMKFGQDHFRHCLDYLKRDIVVNIVRPKNYEKKEEEFAINVPAPTKYYGKVAGMFTQTVIDHNWDLGENPCVRDEKFQSVWIDYLTKNSPEKLAPFCQSKDPSGRCVLYELAKAGADKLVRYLCEHPDRQTLTLTCPCRREDELSCPIEGAVSGDQPKTFTYLLTIYTLNQAEVTDAVNVACALDRVRVLKVILSQLHEDREQTIKEGLGLACQRGCASIVRYLLSEVCTSCEVDKCGCVEGLLTASRFGQTEIVRVILSSGHKAGINRQNDAGVSPLHLLAHRLHNAIVTELVDNGADLNIADKWGQTPLHAAMMRTGRILLEDKRRRETDKERSDRRRDVAQTLLHKTGVIMTTDQWGRTALDVAKHRGYTNIVELFGSHGYESRNVDRQWLEPNKQDREDMQRAGYRR